MPITCPSRCQAGKSPKMVARESPHKNSKLVAAIDFAQTAKPELKWKVRKDPKARWQQAIMQHMNKWEAVREPPEHTRCETLQKGDRSPSWGYDNWGRSRRQSFHHGVPKGRANQGSKP